MYFLVLSKNPSLMKKSNLNHPSPEWAAKLPPKPPILSPGTNLPPSKKESLIIPKSKLTKHRISLFHLKLPQNSKHSQVQVKPTHLLTIWKIPRHQKRQKWVQSSSENRPFTFKKMLRKAQLLTLLVRLQICSGRMLHKKAKVRREWVFQTWT